MSFPILIMIVVCVGVPFCYAVRIWRIALPSRLLWLAVIVEAAIIVGLISLVGRWDIVGYFSRFVLLAIFLIAIIRSGWRHANRPWLLVSTSRDGALPWPTLASIVIFGGALVHVLAGAQAPEVTRQLAFPLQGGRFMVAQGGGIAALNHHTGHATQRYAIDFTAINAAGFRAAGILPRGLGRYAIFGASIVSPCEGTVIYVRDGLPDLVPPSADPDHPAGNHVIIDCGDIEVELAHLKEGSIRVATGDQLVASAAIGQVGNSGNTTEPHLHIHALDPRTGRGVPITFGGRWPVRNSLLSQPS